MRVGICHKCASRSCGGTKGPCGGVMLCTLNGKSIIDNAASGECGLGKFSGAEPQREPRPKGAFPPAPRVPRPGDVLARIIKSATGIDANSVDPTTGKRSCRCKHLQAEMDRWGWWGCWRNRQKIVEHLAAEAAKRGLAVSPSLASLIWAGVREWRGRRS